MEIGRLDPEDNHVYAFVNVSHIPTARLVEIFSIDLEQDPNILEAYFITPEIYEKHQEYLREQIGAFNLEVFEYSLRQYATEDIKQIRNLYKEDLWE